MPSKTSKSLFSEHYLTHRLADHREWREDAGAALAACHQLYMAKKALLSRYNEDQTEEEFILPLLRNVLGFEGAYTVEASVRRQGRTQRPDYTLFANAASKTEADRHLGDDAAFYSRAVAIADAKYWQRPLSQKRAGDERDAWQNSNPSFQIVNYLVATRVDWGILTNGRIWRLYSRQISGTATEFYEVDLVDILEPDCTEIIKPLLRGADLRPWYQESEGRWLIVIPLGWTVETFGDELDEERAWHQLKELHSGIASHLQPYAEAARKRQDQGQYWWELRACDYYDEFDRPKIFWPDIAKLPRFSWDDRKQYINNKGYIIPNPHPSLLGILQSRVLWFAVSQICQPLRLRAGLWQYQMFTQFTSRLPIPDMTDEEKEKIGQMAMKITELAQSRYQLHQKSRHRILTDLGIPGGKLNNRLTQWWRLKFPAFRNEIKKVFKRDIPLEERDEWEAWFNERRARHRQYTAEIVRLETELNERVYALFDLTAEEIKIIEESTRYKYGEV